MSYTPTNPYVAISEVIQELKMKPTDVYANGALLDELFAAIDRASRWVDDYTQRDYVLHDFSVVPMQYDQFTEHVYEREIFVHPAPILSIANVVLGDTSVAFSSTPPGFTGNGVAMTRDTDYSADTFRLYLLPNAFQFIVVDGDNRGWDHGRRSGWRLHRPDRILFVWGKCGYNQPLSYNMTVAGDTGAQTSNWKLSTFTGSAPTLLYWSLKLTSPGVVTVTVYADSGATQIVAQGAVPSAGAQTVILYPMNNSGINGSVSLSYTADTTGAGNTLTPGTNPAPPVDTTAIPQALPGKITMATRLVAAAFSGHNRKEWVGLDGSKQSVMTSEIPKTVFNLLGRKAPILT